MNFRLILLLLSVCCGSTYSKPLELKRAILATNNDPFYIDLWPVVAPLWKQMGLQPTLALIADEPCDIDTTLGDVIYFPSIPGVSAALHTQAIRLLLPALFPDEGCIVSDIDMLPISRSYYFNGAKECPDDSFLIYRDKDGNPEDKQYPMCYIAAKGAIFGSIFGVTTKDDFPRILSQWNDLGFGWFTDQLILFKEVNEWESRGGKVTRLGHGLQPRLDRLYWFDQLRNLDISQYVDCHCPRPYLQYKRSIDIVAEVIKSHWRREDR